MSLKDLLNKHANKMNKKYIIDWLKSLEIQPEDFCYRPHDYIENVKIVHNEDIGRSILDDPENYDEHNIFKIIFHFEDFNLYLQCEGGSNSSMERYYYKDFDEWIEVIPAKTDVIDWEEVENETKNDVTRQNNKP